ncbi:MAG TPA: respiratory nitrate reductase subunit gamma, partial [Acidimicrobiia bacterium]|nr:respiratory nitrate reductase subunit gamma [Acidimicrobiia bacterium]
MTLTQERQDEVTTSRRPSVSYVLEGLGIAGALGTLAMGLLGTIPEEPGFEIGREVFGNIPDAVQLVFYVTVAVFIWASLHLLARRAAAWERGRPEARTGMWGRRIRDLHGGLLMKTLMRDPRAGVMHSLIYYGFFVLFLGTVTLEIDHLLPGNLKFLHGQVYQGYSAILDLASLAYLAGLALAIVNRYLVPPDRLRTKTKPEDALILGLLVILGLSGLLTEAARISLAGRPQFEVWSFVGYPLSSLIPESGASDLHRVFWIGHVLSFVGFLVILPVTKLRHMLTSPANLFLSAHPRPKGAMRAMPNLLEADDIDSIGASLATDLTWKQIFDTDACT